MTETNGTMCMQAQSTSSSSTSSAVQLFDIVASDKTRVVDGPTDGECDDDECYEDDGNEIEQGETNDTDNECDECEKANEGQFEVVDPPSCDEDLGCSDQGN